MPTPEQLKAYADQLPKLYRDILTAFGRATEPVRRYLEGVSTDVLETQLVNQGTPYSDSEVFAALERLERSGFFSIEVQDLTYAAPTPLGEDLLAAVTGKAVPKIPVPDLPKPTW